MVYTVNGIQFTRRKKIKLSHSGALTDYQLKLTITYEAAMQVDFDDIRFSTLVGVNIPYWIESKTNSSTADVWIKYNQADGDTYIYMHYGNSGLNSASGGSNVFIQSHGAATGSYHDPNVISGALIYEAQMSMSTSEARFRFGVGTTILWYNEDGIVFDGYELATNGTDGYTADNGSYSNLGMDSVLWGLDVKHKFKFIYTSSSTEFFKDGNSLGSLSLYNPDASMGLIISYYAGTILQDWAFIRQYTVTEPTSSIETEQHQRRIPIFQ